MRKNLSALLISVFLLACSASHTQVVTVTFGNESLSFVGSDIEEVTESVGFIAGYNTRASSIQPDGGYAGGMKIAFATTDSEIASYSLNAFNEEVKYSDIAHLGEYTKVAIYFADGHKETYEVDDDYFSSDYDGKHISFYGNMVPWDVDNNPQHYEFILTNNGNGPIGYLYIENYR